MEKKPKSTIIIFSSECVITEEGYQGTIDILNAIVRIKYKNVITSLAEANIEVIIEPLDSVPTKAFRFHLKANSDSNKASLASQLKLAFSELASGWTLIVNELTVIFIEALNNHKQNFILSEVEGNAKEYLFEPLITEHSINVFFGMGSAGKTLISLYFSILYGQGKTIWGKQGKQGNTLLIDFENDQLEWRDKLRALLGDKAMDLDTADKTFHYWNSEQVPLYNQVEKLKNYIRENKISLVIVDSASMAAGDSTSDEAAALRLMASLKILDTTIVLIAHQRKTEGEENPIGSIQYFNQARNIWHIEGRPDDTDDRILHIACVHKKNNNGLKWKKPIGIKAFYGEGFIDMHPEDAQNNFDEKFTISDRILGLLKNGALNQKQIADELGVKETVIKTTLNRLKGRNKLLKINDNWALYPIQ